MVPVGCDVEPFARVLVAAITVFAGASLTITSSSSSSSLCPSLSLVMTVVNAEIRIINKARRFS